MSAHNNKIIITNLFKYQYLRQLESGHHSANGSYPGLDYYGCDGRPWRNADGGKQESEGKTLPDRAQTFIDAAHNNRRRGLLLIENHNFAAADIQLMNKRLPKVLTLKPEQLIYYYYPRNVEKPEESMAVIRKHLQKK